METQKGSYIFPGLLQYGLVYLVIPTSVGVWANKKWASVKFKISTIEILPQAFC